MTQRHSRTFSFYPSFYLDVWEKKTTAMNRLKGKIKIKTKLLICLYPMSLALSMHQLHSLLLYTHYVLCTQISVSEMNKIRQNHHFTKLNVAGGVETGSCLLLPPLQQCNPSSKTLETIDGARNGSRKIIRRSEF